ncbi:MAG: Fpg/Nei family DNA glycosylase [Candidatus Aquicultorales bacterium]
MPELPDVELERRSLRERILGKEIFAFEVVRSAGKLTRTLQDVDEEEFRGAVVGQAFDDLLRRGKFLIAPLTSGDTVVFHFMLSGWLYYFEAGETPAAGVDKNAKLRFEFTDRSRLIFSDPRNLGKVFLVKKGEPYERLGVFARIGIEPLSPEFTLSKLSEILRKSSKPIKDLLRDQDRIAGIGNVYSDEILRRAGVRPDRSAATLADGEIEAVYEAIPRVLEEAIEDLEKGRPPHMLEWRKKGASCPAGCGEVKAVKHGASHYYWCPSCQK